MVAGTDFAPIRIRRLLGLAASAACGVLLASPAYANHFDFDLVRTNGLPPGCARGATAHVHVDTSPGFTERLVITVRGFKPGTPLVLFTLQVPNAPFGVGWYQGDVVVGPKGKVKETFITRANIETEALAPVGVAPAPNTHPGKDAKQNKVFKPVHTYHLGIWFDLVEAAEANGCPTNETAFNGDHTAGPQVLNSGRFPDTAGPLSHIQ